MKTIDAKQCTAIALGRLGENEYTVVRFDVSAWLEELPGAVIGLYNQRPGDDTAYPVAGITVFGGIVTWMVTSAELTQTGEGRCELVAIAGEVVAKSAIFRTIVFDALDGSGEAPEPWADWQQQFITLKGEAEQAADRAEEAVEHYPRIVDGVWEVWGGATEQWVSTGVQALGVDGISPTITVAPISGGHRITITDANGTHTVDVLDGENGDAGRGIASVQKTGTAGLVDTYTITYTDSTTSTFTVTNGQNGNDGISPSITVTDITGGHRVTITDAAGAHSFDVMNGDDGHGIPTGGTAGQVLEKTSGADYAVSWADKNPVVQVSGTTPTINALPGIQYVCGECATLDITLPASGCVDVVFTSGSTPTVLTVTPQTGMTAEWANGFDSTALEADTLYELNIKMVGTKCLGVAASWT